MPLEWWPLTRDCAIYGSIVIGLAVVVSDNRIFRCEGGHDLRPLLRRLSSRFDKKNNEPIVSLKLYLYLHIVMFYNRTWERWANAFVKQIKKCFGCHNETHATEEKDGQVSVPSGV